MSSSLVPALHHSEISSGMPSRVALAPTPKPPDIICRTVENGTLSCEIDDAGIVALRRRALPLIRKSVDVGYEHLPIDRTALVRSILSGMLDRDGILTAITGRTGATEKNHNKLRNKYKSTSFTPNEARTRGIVARRLTLRKVCPPDYDWEHSPVYNDADSCSDVQQELEREGMPAVMYAANLDAESAQWYLDQLAAAPLYTRYVSAPVLCAQGRDEGGNRSIDAYHHVYVYAHEPLKIDIEYVMRSTAGTGWSAWTLRRSCTTDSGSAYRAADLMFDFGSRVFLPVSVSLDGQLSERTIVIDTVAAASTSLWQKFLPRNLGYHRLIGGTFAKRLLLEAYENNWKIKGY